MEHTIHVKGGVPSKKNDYRRRAGGGMYLPEPVRRELNAIVLQIKSQWSRPPLKQARVHAKFYVNDRRSDLDNRYTAISDALVDAGCIEDDNLAHIDGFSAEAVFDPSAEESVKITLKWMS
jgi:Holliday junction resolvase RusA-like endonuclease